MGNKHGKFNVAATNGTDIPNKENAEIVVQDEIKAEEVQVNGGDHVISETVKPEESEAQIPPKKKNVISWLKKVSMRKEKKPKVAKQNGVKEEIVDNNKEVDKIEDVNNLEENAEDVKDLHNTHEEVIISNGHCDEEKEELTVPAENHDEVLTSNGHVENHVDEVGAESPVEDQQ